MLLDPGERDAIAVAVSMPTAHVLLDDRAARDVARALGLTVIGTLGVLVEGKRRGIVSTIRPLLEQLIANGRYLAPELVDRVLRSVGER